MADINGNSRKKVEKLTMEEIADRLEGLKSSLDTIRRTASELITGIEEQLKELRRDRDIMQEQEKESLLLVQNSDLSEYSLCREVFLIIRKSIR